MKLMGIYILIMKIFLYKNVLANDMLCASE